MSSYFDKAASDAAVSIEDAIVIEDAMVADILLVTGDREFPDDLRQKIVAVIANQKIDAENGSDRGRRWYESMACSKLIGSLHSLFHEVAQRRIETRFGVLNDRPSSILMMRDGYLEGGGE